LSERRRKHALEEFKKYISKQKSNFLGFQANQKMDSKTGTADFLDCSLNNLGDPFKGGSFTVKRKLRSYNHLYAMEHVTEELIARFVKDLECPNAFPAQEESR
jgi:hypothetical protein